MRKVFSLLGQQATAAGTRLQIIVLDHADEEARGDLEGVALAEQWRDQALVPYVWLG